MLFRSAGFEAGLPAAASVPTTGPRGSTRDGVGSSGQEDRLVPAASRRGSARTGGGIDLLGLGPCGGAERACGGGVTAASTSVWGVGAAWTGTGTAAVCSPVALMRQQLREERG